VLRQIQPPLKQKLVRTEQANDKDRLETAMDVDKLKSDEERAIDVDKLKSDEEKAMDVDKHLEDRLKNNR
jgi:hypothetical protein